LCDGCTIPAYATFAMLFLVLLIGIVIIHGDDAGAIITGACFTAFAAALIEIASSICAGARNDEPSTDRQGAAAYRAFR
jgi:hypothetical protein